LAPDCMTDAPETDASFLAPVSGAGFWSVCQGYKEPCTALGSRFPMGMGNFVGETGEPLYSIGTLCSHVCKMAEPVEVPLGSSAMLDPRESRSPIGRGNSGG